MNDTEFSKVIRTLIVSIALSFTCVSIGGFIYSAAAQRQLTIRVNKLAETCKQISVSQDSNSVITDYQCKDKK